MWKTRSKSPSWSHLCVRSTRERFSEPGAIPDEIALHSEHLWAISEVATTPNRPMTASDPSSSFWPDDAECQNQIRDIRSLLELFSSWLPRELNEASMATSNIEIE